MPSTAATLKRRAAGIQETYARCEHRRMNSFRVCDAGVGARGGSGHPLLNVETLLTQMVVRRLDSVHQAPECLNWGDGSR